MHKNGHEEHTFLWANLSKTLEEYMKNIQKHTGFRKKKYKKVRKNTCLYKPYRFSGQIPNDGFPLWITSPTRRRLEHLWWWARFIHALDWKIPGWLWLG
jgi:hypothetical protein